MTPQENPESCDTVTAVKRRIACASLCLALLVGLAVLVGPGCYDPPKPDCGFVCGPGGACPDDYTCAADNRCHRNGTPASLMCATSPDARPDTTSGDAGIDAPIDAPGTDAALDADVDADIDAL